MFCHLANYEDFCLGSNSSIRWSLGKLTVVNCDEAGNRNVIYILILYTLLFRKSRTVLFDYVDVIRGTIILIPKQLQLLLHLANFRKEKWARIQGKSPNLYPHISSRLPVIIDVNKVNIYSVDERLRVLSRIESST
jgi:hypothetical protein